MSTLPKGAPRTQSDLTHTFLNHNVTFTLPPSYKPPDFGPLRGQNMSAYHEHIRLILAPTGGYVRDTHSYTEAV